MIPSPMVYHELNFLSIFQGEVQANELKILSEQEKR